MKRMVHVSVQKRRRGADVPTLSKYDTENSGLIAALVAYVATVSP